MTPAQSPEDLEEAEKRTPLPRNMFWRGQPIVSNQFRSKSSNQLCYPWTSCFNHIKSRCERPKSARWERYGGRGIKCLITPKEIKTLWFRDKAYLMKKPSIDRIDNDGNYEFSNCRFVELYDNLYDNIMARYALITHCPKGHPYSKENTVRW